MQTKWVHLSLGILMIIFGVLQYNDPDFWLWGPVYFIPGIIALLHMKRNVKGIILKLLSGLYLLYLIFYIPDVIAWIAGGMDNIAGSMKAEEPHIELTREFFGLVICLAILLFYYKHSKEQGTKILNL
jgi:hypothetical protein